MPDGRTHDALTLVTASFATPICLGITFDGNPGRAALVLGSYLVSGLLFSDDLDIHSIEFKRWKLLRFLWLPYQKLIPHRSWLSHGLIVGPALRIMYFASMCTLTLWTALLALSRLLPLDAGGVLGSLVAALARSLIDHPDAWALGFVGFVLGSVTHIVSDSLWTLWRRAWRRPQIAGEYAADGIILSHHGEPMGGYVQRISYNTANADPPSP